MDLTYEERAKAGADLLDAEYPNWFEEIDLGILRLESPWNCILSQVYDSYSLGMDELGISEADGQAANLGFFEPGNDPEIYMLGYEKLTEAWTAEINKRRN
ncbi:hypothetical protein E1264_03380 [Actinomadura sp. KC216]|uniref:hypothetical protein n=1 Tax=Actinomadura sp. KC216 TaxID=2530370 RepID=UPI0010521F99|nr:hypothetical protein [Actinomadura sp. KC216]TDB90881.1 hypothetical protein E1264_03380 [Actinomadura sp. KC216]